MMSWVVRYSNKATKQYRQLPQSVRDAVDLLVTEIGLNGPVRGNWKNYGKLGSKQHHCHVKSGRPTYVVVGEELDKEIRLVEVVYAGTHEKAPY